MAPTIALVALVVLAAALTLVAASSSKESVPRATLAPAVSSQVAAPSRAPIEESPGPEGEPRQKLLIHAAGDTSLDPNWISTFRTQGYGYAWSGLDGLFERDDLTIVNLECPVSNVGAAVPKEFNFRGDPKALDDMRKGGVDVASLANNHAYDYGPRALLDSVQNISEAGITPIGAGKDNMAATESAMFHLKGWTVAVVPWDSVVDPWPTAVAAQGHPGTAFGHDFNAVVKEVRAVSRKADLTIVQVHWGVELDTRPEPYQVFQGHKLVDVGADMIFGGHSHRLQPLEVYEGKPIFYSLANFVWPNNSTEGATTGVAEVVVMPNGTIKAKILPAFITSPGHPVLR